MVIVPAIDILDGRCVRLHKGRYDRSHVYRDDPAEVAREFEQAGAVWIHVVDLDAARGQGDNRDAVARVKAAVRCGVEVGGGIRSETDIRQLLDAGADRLILGTVLAREPQKVREWLQDYASRLVAGVDALDGLVRVSGWEDETALRDELFVAQLAASGLGRLVYTAIAQDGTLEGPDLTATNRVAAAFGGPTLLSGGISSEQDIAAVVSGADPRVRGVITGKALYEGRIDLAAVIERYQDARDW